MLGFDCDSKVCTLLQGRGSRFIEMEKVGRHSGRYGLVTEHRTARGKLK